MQNRLPAATRQLIANYGVNNGFIELSPAERNSEQLIANKLITALLYESNRHTWDAAHCATLRGYISLIIPTLLNKPRKAYEDYIAAQETANNTFYGSYLSDDSDSDEEAAFAVKNQADKTRILADAHVYQQRGQISKISYQNKTKTAHAGDLKTDMKHASSMFDLNARSTIYHPQQLNRNKVMRDLDHLNILLKKKYSIEEALSELTSNALEAGEVFTNFYIAEYRGVTHLTTKWNKPSRTAHRRDQDEIGQRQYSASVYKAAGVNFFRDYDAAKQTRDENPALFDDPAEELREILLTFREPRPYSYNSYSYSNLAYLLQNIYTEDYYGFHNLINSDPTLKSTLLNDLNPFFSMGDTPYHAGKYAYGLKPYAGHEGDRLRPRWQQDGKAERPYSGVVYTSLHPITDFTSDGPLHLITLNRSAEIKLKSELIIIAERESCFPAFLDEDRIIHKHIAKYPSFKGNYKQIYAYKYGLTEALYNKFKAGFAAAAPHTDANRALKKLLGEWLCSFYEPKLIENARREAEAKNALLIYRANDGTFSFHPPVDSINRNTSSNTEAVKTPIKAKQQKRVSLSSSQRTIQPLLTEKSVSELVDDIQNGYDSDTESASVAHDGNHTMSLPLSLMLNALKNQRYRALKRFLTLPAFQEAVNETFNSDSLENATLLHLAAANNDMTAIKLLTALPHCHLTATADEESSRREGKIDFYEDITAAHLAILRHSNEAATFLLNHPRNDKNAECAFVANKDLLSGDMLQEPTEDDDEDFLGIAWFCREGVTISRTRGITFSQLAIECNNQLIQDILGVRKNKVTLS